MYSHPTSPDSYSACPDCDLLLRKSAPPGGYSTLCPRCGKTISRSTEGSITKVLALSITGLLLYGPAISLPLMTFKSLGFSDSANILESIVNFYQNDYYLVSLMVMLSALVFPLILLTTIFIISLELKRNRYPAYLPWLFRTHLHLEEWAMIEVYLLGILVTVIKMSGSTDIQYHSGVFCFAALVVVTIAITTVVDGELYWRLIEHQGKSLELPNFPESALDEKMVTAAEMGLIRCHICEKLVPSNHNGSECPRCRSIIHNRKPNSIARTSALVITSAIFLVPANLLPIMEVDFLGIPERSTIIDGIIHFFRDGAYLIGLIIFVASILVPIFKVVGLIILLCATLPRFAYHLPEKTKMFRFIVFIGRWSMLDIFVISLLTVLVDFGFFTSIHAAPAASYFSLVVASTMFAATAFDPRILWDCANPTEEEAITPQTVTLLGKPS